ncbi:polyprenyl synthetase family protein [Hwanghaeella sp.]|uniref:polyprenyl synthetase family protein n=1 Tax=Hwanghaeella sp. TaxID=2605943 RepID=UPI003CCC11AC
MDDFELALRGAAERVEGELDRILTTDTAPEQRLIDAMRYSVLGGGKRLRPFLTLQTSKLFSVSERSALRAAAAIELVHCYSLVHDDLPAMDDDDLRRGKPTTHKQFDEATAILAGDALLTLAFGVLANPETHGNPAIRADLVTRLAKAAGGHGMVGGQMIDLSASGADLDIGAITRLQRLKTGALIEFACTAGAVLGNAPAKAREALRGYAHDLGLAFQIADDLLDVEGSADEAGKAVGKDAGHGKATFVSILGPERARAQAGLLTDQAIEHLAIFDDKADLLRSAAKFVVERRH